MRIKALALILIFGFGSAFAQQMSCNDRAKKWQQLLMEYKFAEMDTLVTEGIKACSMESNFEIHHQAALTYLWRGKLDQARPIIEKLSDRAKKNHIEKMTDQASPQRLTRARGNSCQPENQV